MKAKIKKLELNEKDLILINTKKTTTLRDITKMQEELVTAMQDIGVENTALILPEDIELKNVPEHIMNDIGWYRKDE